MSIVPEEFPRYQKSVGQFMDAQGIHVDVNARLLDVLAEVGELAKEALKSTDYGKREFIPTKNWESEMGDAFFSLITLANATDVDLETALGNVLVKYRRRIVETGTLSSGK